MADLHPDIAVLALLLGARTAEGGTLSAHGTALEMDLRDATVGRTSSAKDVAALRRWIRVHLAATLRRRTR